MRLMLAVLLMTATSESTPCTTKCNVQASDCMKACVGDPKDAQKHERGKPLVQCMKACDEENRRCKGLCAK